MSQLQRYIDRFGAVAGPKLYHAIRSRSAYMGANARRRQAIARLTDRITPQRRLVAAGPHGEETGLLPFESGGDLILPQV